jgi:hypothetical protein
MPTPMACLISVLSSPSKGRWPVVAAAEHPMLTMPTGISRGDAGAFRMQGRTLMGRQTDMPGLRYCGV